MGGGLCVEGCCHGNQQLKDNSAFVSITKEEGKKQGCRGRGEIGGGGCKDAPLTLQVTCGPRGVKGGILKNQGTGF